MIRRFFGLSSAQAGFSLGLFFFLTLVGTGVAQTPVPAPATSTAAPQAATPATAPEILARFETSLNTKSAREGDTVTAKTTRELKLKDLDIPKNSKLVGKIVTVQSMRAGNGDSALAIRFDHVELKGGAILRIQGLINSIGPAPQGETGLGYNSVLSRGGVGSTSRLDPSIAADKYDKDTELPKGSSLEGVALGIHFDAAGASELRGVHRDIKLDNGVIIRVALFKGA
jgi:hypothetical protein